MEEQPQPVEEATDESGEQAELLDDPQAVEKADDEVVDEHRGFVREMNSAFSSVYGYGGGAVLAALAAVVVAGWQFGRLGSPLLWIAAVVIFLGSLFVLKIFVRRRAERLLERIRQYSEVNDISPEILRERYGQEGLYPYFDSIFEVVERAQHIRDERGD
ncbi:MAG: hypothetical protein ACLFVJ_19580 [Persicimonas sp.]